MNLVFKKKYFVLLVSSAYVTWLRLHVGDKSLCMCTCVYLIQCPLSCIHSQLTDSLPSQVWMSDWHYTLRKKIVTPLASHVMLEGGVVWAWGKEKLN